MRAPDGSAPLLDIYPAQNLYYYNGGYYGSLAALQAAVGTASGTLPKLTMGPQIVGSDLVQNGANPITDATGWTAVQAGGVVASGGNLVQTNGTGGTSALQLYQPISFTIGSTYEIKVTAIGSFNRQILLVDGSNTTITTLGSGLAAGGASYTFYVAVQTNVARILLRADNVTNGSTAAWTSISIKEARAYTPLTPNGTVAAVRFTTPSSIASDQAIVEFGTNAANAARERGGRLTYVQSTGHLTFSESKNNVARFTQDLGAISASTAYRAAIGLKNAAYYSALGGAAALNNTSADYPTEGVNYLGTGADAADFLGTIARYTVAVGTPTADWVSGWSNPGNYLLEMGDSYVAGSGGVGMAATSTAAGKLVLSPSALATGGTTDVTQLAALQAAPGYKNYNIIWDDGRANTGYDSSLYVANQQTFATFIGHSRYIRVLPVTVPGDDGATQAKILATCAALKAIIPVGNYVDPTDYIPNTAGVINADQLQVDGVHPTQAAMDLLWAGVDAKATALGMYNYVAP